MIRQVEPRKLVLVAAVALVDADGRVLLAQRPEGKPLAGLWEFPGGKVEPGETPEETLLRELREETACEAELVGLVDVVDAVMRRSGAPDAPPWGHYVLIDYAARWLSGAPRPGDDAREARFFRRDELDGLGLWDETARVIAAARAMLQP